MQAGATKAERKASLVARAKARPGENYKRANRRIPARLNKKAAIANREAIKKTAASPAAIALTKATYKEQCLAFEASKETEDVSSNG